MQLKTNGRFGNVFKTLSVATLVALATTGASAETGGADGFAAKGAVTTGETGPSLTVTIDVAPEYHWNQEYPAKFEVIGDLPAGVTVPQRVVKAKDGGVTATAQKATAAIPFVRGPKTSGPVTVQARFSICNDRVCLMKSAKVDVNVSAR